MRCRDVLISLEFLLKHNTTLITSFLLLGLTIVGLSVLAAIGFQMNLALLGLLLLLESYLISFVLFKTYQQIVKPQEQLNTYLEALIAGENNLSIDLKPGSIESKLFERLAYSSNLSSHSTQSPYNSDKSAIDFERTLFSQMMNNWPSVILIFNKNGQLFYKNESAQHAFQRPMLFGDTYDSMGFKTLSQLSHPLLEKGWMQQSIRFSINKGTYYLYSAVDISPALSNSRNIEQNNMVRVISHEIRNSLTPIESLTETLLLQPDIDPDNLNYVLTRINKRSKKLLSFIKGYSDVAKITDAKCDWFNSDELLHDIKSVSARANQINYSGPAVIFGDQNLLSQALINLVLNSEQAYHSEYQNLDGWQLKIQVFNENAHQAICVTDNGPGFSNIDNVSTPFYTTKSEGTGIGLSVVKEIAKRHNGQVEVKNITPNGAQIILSIKMTHHAA
ncbi:hypothetical protein GNP35_09135 [Psychrosphaera haliotis]|uniref:histidine kinase n=1 Tax=Psychrosphaera haliotis TaxID=555083 RepID=A0A6N8FBV0_9GAMM|nr:hypothetical protein [Psychrosphaera haliotis]